MFSKFDEDAQKILLMAKKEMISLKHPYVGSEHLLLSILHNIDLEVTKILNDYQITYEKYRNEIIRVIGMGKTTNTWFLYTPLLKRIIENAMLDSKEDNSCVTVEKLFISLLEEGDGVANRVLLGMNIDVDLLYDKFSDKFSYKKGGSRGKLLIEDYAVDLNNKFRTEGFDPVVGRDEIVNRIIEILLRRTKNNPLLVGEAGVGKTAIVEELTRRIEKGSVPKKIEGYRILSVSTASLVAGTKYRGEFEERINKIVEELENEKKIILFIDEIHTLVGAGGAEGAIDASNILKPSLARGKLKIIGATTREEYNKFFEYDKALDRRFQKVYIEEATLKETEDILFNLREIYENYHGVKISDEVIKNIVSLSDKYVTSGHQPDKAIDILDEVCSKTSMIDSSYDKKVKALTMKLNELKLSKNKAIINHDYKLASSEKDRQLILESKLNGILNKSDLGAKIKSIDLESLYDVIYLRTKIPVKKIISLDKRSIYLYLSNVVIGQNQAIKDILDIALSKRVKRNKSPHSLLLVGKSGVGKTFLVKEYAKLLYSSSSFIRIDMSEFREEHTISKIIGSPPGYVGYSDNNYILKKIKDNPYSVILLDEIEKANKNVLKLFLQVFDEGCMTTSSGEAINFSNTTIFMTSNLGIDKNPIGFSSDKVDNIRNSLNDFLGVELLNRIDSVIYFKEITKKDIEKIVRNNLKEVLNNIDINKLDYDKIVNKIVDECDYLNYGARKINKIIDSKLDQYVNQIN